MKTNKGQNTIEFILIIIFVAIACILVYTLFGDEICKLLDNSDKKVEKYQPFAVSYNKDTGARKYKGGELGGTKAAPARVCEGSSCNIDFGDFVLTGLPEKFNEFIQTSGSSGGTEALENMLNQIAANLEDQGKTAQSEKIKELANLGHFISSYEKQFEDDVKTCSTKSDPKACVLAMEPLRLPLAENISKLVPGYDPSVSTFLSEEGDELINPGTVANTCFLAKSSIIDQSICDNARTSSVSGAFLSKYEEIMKDDDIPESARGVVEGLYNEIGLLGGQLRFKACILQDTGGCNPVTSPVDGEKQIILDHLPYEGTVNEIMSSYSSNVSTLDSVLICAAGWNKTTGSSCYD